MHENRTAYPKKKSDMHAQILQLSSEHRVVALIRMEKVRASQILQLRKKLKDQVKFVSVKDRVAVRALEKVGIKGVEKLIQDISGQCMLIFTSLSPFRLNIMLAKNKIMLGARGGDVASIDVIIPARNTGIAPGPMLTEFKEANIPTKIDQGTIWISKDTTPVKKGEVINEKLAAMLGKLDIKPIEAGISLHSAIEEGNRYDNNDMTVDIQAVADSVAQAHNEAMNLSIDAGYVTPLNIAQILAKCAASARSLSIESGHMTEETRDAILSKAHDQANSLIHSSGYEPS